MLPIKEHLQRLVRTKNPSESRRGYLRLDKNESALPLPPELVAELRQAVTDELLMMYPELDALTKKLAAWLGCRAENIAVAAGSDPAIKSLFEVFVSPGDRVLLPSPTYQMFAVYARTFQAELVEVHYGSGLALSMDDLLKAMVDCRPKLACLANPNSPTGTVFPRQEVLEFIRTGAKLETVVHIDEAYYHFYPETAVDLIDRYPNLAVTRTFSKAVGLAAARMGFVAAHEDMIRCLQKVRPMYETNGLAARFSEIMLDHMEVVDRNVQAMLEGKIYLETALDALGIFHYPTHANFMLIDAGSRDKSREIAARLKAARILIGGDFAHPALARCIRVGLGNREQMERFMRVFKAIWSEDQLAPVA